MIYRGNITGDLKRLDITPGYYCIGAPKTISNGILTDNGDCWCQFIQWGDSYRTQYIVDGSGVHSRYYIGSPAAWTKWNLANGSGSGVINKSVVNTSSSSPYVRWVKWEYLVFVTIYDLDIKAGISTDNGACVIATGLPQAAYGEFIHVLPGQLKTDGSTYYCRFKISSAGKLELHYIGPTKNILLSGTFIYLLDGTHEMEWRA